VNYSVFNKYLGGKGVKKIYACFTRIIITFQYFNVVYQIGVLQPEWWIKYTSQISNGDAEARGIDTDEEGCRYWATSQYRRGLNAYFDVVTYKLDDASNKIWLTSAIIINSGVILKNGITPGNTMKGIIL